MKLQYVIAFVADMPAAVAFHRDVLGLTLRFQSPGWSEFETGTTTLALHPANAGHAPGTMQLGLSVDDIQAFTASMKARGFRFTREPAPEHGIMLARFLDAGSTEYSVSGPMRPKEA